MFSRFAKKKLILVSGQKINKAKTGKTFFGQLGKPRAIATLMQSSAVHRLLEESRLGPSMPRLLKAFAHERTCFRKPFPEIPDGTKSRFPSLCLRTQSSLNSNVYFINRSIYKTVAHFFRPYRSLTRKAALVWKQYDSRRSILSPIFPSLTDDLNATHAA